MNPPPTPPEEGSQCRSALAEFPSWEGPGVGRFMGSLPALLRTHRDHEPPPHPTSSHALPHWWRGRGEGLHGLLSAHWDYDHVFWSSHRGVTSPSQADRHRRIRGQRGAV